MRFCLLFSLSVFFFLPSTINAQQTARKIFERAQTTHSLDSASMLYEEAILQARKSEKHNFADSVLFSLGKKYVSKGKLMMAREVAERGLERNNPGYKSNMTAGFYNMKAITFHHMSDLDSALIYYLKAVAELEARKDTLKAATIRFNIGNIFLSYKDWEQANEHFLIMLNAIERYNDSTYLAGVLSSLSATQFEMGNEQKSKEYAEKALKIAKGRNDALGQMLSLRQLGQIANSNNNLEQAIDDYQQALSIAEMIGMPYYLALINMNLCGAYGKAGEIEAAIKTGEKSLEYSDDPGFATQLPMAYRLLSEAYEYKGDYENAFRHLSLSTELRDQEITEENKKIVNELLVKYETEKKDRQIVEQKLKIAEKEKQNFIYLAAVLFSLLIIAFLIWFIGLRQRLNKARIKQMEQQKEQELLLAIVEGEEMERKRIATALHDGLSNVLFTVKLSLSSIENLNPVASEKLNKNIDLLDEVREDTRRLSHNLMPMDLENKSLVDAFGSYINRLNETSPKIDLFFQSFGKKSVEFSSSRKILLFRAVQEIVGNALKHAHAKEIAVQLFHEEKQMKITIEDDGKGFNPDQSSKGQGLRSLKQRIKLMNGTFDVDTTINKGTMVTICINY